MPVGLYTMYLVCLLLLILKPFTITTHEFAVQPASLCNCIRVKDCKPFTDRLLNHAPHEREALFQRIRDAGCDYEGGDSGQPLVCCPNSPLNNAVDAIPIEINVKGNDKLVRRMSRNNFAEDSHQRSLEPWIWDRTPLQPADMITSGNDDDRITDRFDKFVTGGQSNFRNDFQHFGNIEGQKNTKRNYHCSHAFREQRNVDGDDDFHHHNSHHDSTQIDHYHYHHHHHHDHDDDDSYINSFSHLSNPFDTKLDDFDATGSDEDEPKYPAYKIIFPSAISRKSKPLPQQPQIVTSSKSMGNPTTSTPTLTSPRSRGTFNNSPECGTSVSNRVLGGTDSTPGQFPWIARIGYLNRTSNAISYRCSGSVVSDLYILTAAHCLQDLGLEVQLFHILIGDAQVINSSRIFNISNIISHPNYNQPRFANDIALVRINRPQNMGDSLSVICLPLDNSESFTDRLIGSTGIVAGWSSNSDGTAVENAGPKFLRLPIVNTTACAIGYATRSEQFEVPIVITPSQLCAQGQPLQDSCQGDSGGPFMDDGTSGLINSDGRYTLLGIVAFGWPGCSNQSNILPGVYTRVSSFVGWIAGNIS